MKAIIEFKGYRINKLNYEVIDNDEIKALADVDKSKVDNSFKFALNSDQTSGKVIVESDVIDIYGKRKVHAELEANFKINKEKFKDKEEIKSSLAVNGTAMLFPYVRSVISFLSTLDSENAILIPTLNVVEALNEGNSTNGN